MAPVAALWISGALVTAFQTLWQGILAITKWAIQHAHITKIVAVCFVILVAFRAGRLMHNYVMSTIATLLVHIKQSTPRGGSFALDLLAQVNYCLPVSEMLALLTLYITLAGFCLSLRFLISLWRSTPFKAT